MSVKNVLITDGYWRKTLACVRALAKEGVNVSVGERTPLATALFSRYVSNRYVYPSVSCNPQAFINWLKNKLISSVYDVLLVPEEETALLVASYKDVLSKYTAIPLAEHSKISFVRNKFKLLAFACQIGIPCPETRLISSIAEIQDIAASLTYPVVLKPIFGSGSRGVTYIENINQLNERAPQMLTNYETFILQEYVPGDKYFGVSVLFNKTNQLRAAFVHEKLRQYPITGGASTYAISVRNPTLVSLSEKLMQAVGWYGLANLEFKLDCRDNQFKLMEVNPRMWGALHLAVSAGINFPYLLCKLALNSDIWPQFDYKLGVKYRWFLPGDLMSFAGSFLKYRKIDPSFFNLFEKDLYHAIGSLADPLPVLGRILSGIDFLTSKEMKKIRSRN